MTKIRNMKRPRLATIAAGLALFIVLGGSATAASGLINGKKIKRGTVTAKQLKNKTITKGKLKPSLVSSLKGAQGPQGEKGEPGEKGAAGANGIVEPVFAEGDVPNIPANTEKELIAKTVPSGRYMVTARISVFSTGTSIVSCGIGTSGSDSDSVTWSSPVNGSRSTIPSQLVTAAAVTEITVSCHSGNSIGSADANLIATPIG